MTGIPSSLKTAFDERLKETVLYLQYSQAVAAVTGRGMLIDAGFDVNSAEEIQKMTKATCFLLIYNLAESTVALIMEEISSHINRARISIRDLPIILQEIMIRGAFKNGAPATRDASLVELLELASSLAPITIFPNSNALNASGNVDARWVRSMAETYGFSYQCSSDARGGKDLLTVKNRRNGLAHGNFSFCDCGREYTIGDVEEIGKSSIAFLTDVVESVDRFLAERLYSASAALEAITGLTDAHRADLHAAFRDASGVFRASEAQLVGVPGMSSSLVDAIVREGRRLGYGKS